MRFVVPVPPSIVGEELLGKSTIPVVVMPAENGSGFAVVLREEYERLTGEERKQLVDSWRARSRTEPPDAVVRLRYCFEDYPEEDVYEICHDAMRFMKGTLGTAERRYWKRSTGHT